MTKNINKIIEMNSKTSELTKFAKKMDFIPESIKSMIETHKKFTRHIPKFEIPQLQIPNLDHFKMDIPKFNIPKIDFINSELLETLEKISKIGDRVKNNPEMQFSFITDLEILNLKSAEELKATLTTDLADEDIKQKEEILNTNLIPYLEELEIQNLWYGAGHVLESQSNPDKLRHCLISLRTILEYMIDEKLAPKNELKNSPMFKTEFKRYHQGKQKIELVKINRAKRIEFFASKIEFGVLEDFTKNEIKYICDCYSILCNVHQPNIGITENQVRSLKVKTGITIWLLAYIHKIING